MAEQEQQQSPQGNVRSEFNLGRKGLNMDLSVNQVEKGSLTYALNAALENFDASSVNYQNEPGNELCLNFPQNFQVIGEHFIPEQNKHVFFLTNPQTGDCQIGYMVNNDCNYVQYISARCLNFNINYPILKAVHKITNCTTEIYWTDGYNPRRFLDLQNPPWVTISGGNICEDTPEIGVVDCNKLKVQPNFSIPEISLQDVVTGGNLLAGTYQFAIQYGTAFGDPYTSYYSITNPIPIANTQLTTPNFNYPVGKSIVLNIKNIDTTGYFQYYNIAIIKTINDITSVELVGTYYIDNTSKEITYTGQNVTSIPLTLGDIYEKFPYYDIAQDLTTARDIIIWDQVTSIDEINYQSIANRITLLWETYKIPSTENYANPFNASNLRGYLRDEVYPFEITFLLDNGKQTDSFHIPGRAKNYNEFSQPNIPNTNPDFIPDGSGATTLPYWKIYNTASVLGEATGPTIGNATPYQYGEFAYWESTEKYPCNTLVWGDLADQPIRHHKFPDIVISPAFESATPTINSSGTYNVEMQTSAAVYPIGVKVDVEQVRELINASNLTVEQKAQIIGFKITRGNRSTNQSIVAKGILRNVGKYTRDTSYNNPTPTYYYYPNYPYNDLNPDPFLLSQNNAYNQQCQSYQLVVTTAGTIQYNDCNDGQLITVNMPTTLTEICSISYPVVLSGSATITNVTAIGFTLTCFVDGTSPAGKSALFQYTDPNNPSSLQQITVFVDNPQTVNSTTIPVHIGGSNKYSIAESNRNVACYPSQLDGFQYDSKYRMVFNSPETSFGQPTLGSVIKMENVIFGAGEAHFIQVKNNAQYKLLTADAQLAALISSFNIANLGGFDATAMFTAYQAYLQIYLNGISRQNYAYSFNSVATYDYSAPIQNNQSIKQRSLDICQYLIPGVESVGDKWNVNNYQRESSVYIKTSETTPSLPFPSDTTSLAGNSGSLITDTSRFTLGQSGHCDTPEYLNPINVISYYGSIKNIIPNQWGQMYSYQTIDTGFQRIFNNISSSDSDVVFGGDTFIGRFAFKTKLPFFIDNRVGAPDDSDIFFDEIGNVAFPQFWHSARSILYNWTTPNHIVLNNIISIKAHNFDCSANTTTLIGTTTTTSSTTTSINGNVTSAPLNAVYTGKMYLFAYGIPYYYTESSINVDLRQAFNNQEGDFYPHVSTGIPDNWLQQTFVPIAFDNTYTYNVTYSKQNTENSFTHLPVNYSGNPCYSHFPFRGIYSDPQQSYTDNRVNNWLIYRPVSSFDFPENYGKLVSLDGIQNKGILARFENKGLVYNSLLTINTSNPQAAYIGNDQLFKSAPPQDFAETDIGYMGTQNKLLIKIPEGQVSVDAKRGQIFLISLNMYGRYTPTDLTAFGSGMNRFFSNYLPFQILKYFSNVNTDNHFNGIGLHGVYDAKYDRIILTKLDYIPIDDTVQYDEETQEFYVNKTYGTTTLRKVIQLTDRNYFCNKSWTLSFNFNSKTWVSFHSYLPNFYVTDQTFFYSGLNQGCDLTAIAINEIPTPTTTTTTTVVLNCEINGNAVFVSDNCSLDGTAVCVVCTTTTTTTIAPTCVTWNLAPGSTGSQYYYYDCGASLQNIAVDPVTQPEGVNVCVNMTIDNSSLSGLPSPSYGPWKVDGDGVMSNLETGCS